MLLSYGQHVFACVQQVLSICSKCSLNMLSMFLCLLLMLKMFNAYAHHVHRIFLACTWNHAWHVFNMYSVYTNIFKALHREIAYSGSLGLNSMFSLVIHCSSSYHFTTSKLRATCTFAKDGNDTPSLIYP